MRWEAATTIATVASYVVFVVVVFYLIRGND